MWHVHRLIEGTWTHTVMFRITSKLAEDEVVLKVEGCLAGACVSELDALWRNAAATASGRRVRIDLTDVCHVDAAGRHLMASMYVTGVRFVARGCVIPELVREIADTAGALPGSRS